MNKQLLIGALTLSVAACGNGPDIDGQDKVSTDPVTPMTCAALTIPVQCANPQPGSSPGTPHVNININAGPNPIMVTPPNVCAQTTRTIEFKISPANLEPGSVAILPKKPLVTPWLTGTNSDDPTQINVLVPAWVTPSNPEEGYDYYVYYGDDCLDPRVHVM